MKMWLRQGDVLIEKVEKVPKGAEKKDNVLAYGEVTGHKHVVIGQAEVLLHEGTQYIRSGGGEVVHEEHETVGLPEGAYVVSLQRERDLVEGTRQVMD